MGQFVPINADGQAGQALSLGLTDPVNEFGGLVGNGSSTLEAKTGDFPDVTYWDETMISVGPGYYEPLGQGSRLASRAPNIGYHTNYNAVRILTEVSPDFIFENFVKTFSGVNAGTQATVSIPGDKITAVGQRITFTLPFFIVGALQGPFDAEVIRLDHASRTLVAKTVIEGNPLDPLMGHPLDGWRYWRVSQVTAGEVLVETGTLDRPAFVPGILGQINSVANFANYFLFREAQTLIWSQYMQHIVDGVNGIRTSPTFLKDGVWDDPVFNRSYIMGHVCGHPITTGFCQ